MQLLKQLAAALESRYPATHGHSRRVARHAAAIARGMGLSADDVRRVQTAATVHDIGKVVVPTEIINKPGALTEAEYAQVKRHAEIGARMVAGLGDRELVRIVRHHHERVDGAGYPDGLTGTQIPVGARIIAVADTFDAVTSTRPYRPAMPPRDGLAVLSAEAGRQLDAAAVRAFRRHYATHHPLSLGASLLNARPRRLLASVAAEAKSYGTVAAAALAAVVEAGIAVSHAGGGFRHAPRR